MFILKGCGKCQGDLVPQEDLYGYYLKCLQCGRITEEATVKPRIYDKDQRPTQKQAA